VILRAAGQLVMADGLDFHLRVSFRRANNSLKAKVKQIQNVKEGMNEYE